MSDSKMLLFGSFTEDETRSLLKKQSSGRNERPVEKNKQLQFGSLNFVAGESLGNSSESNNGQNAPKSQDGLPSSGSCKCNGVKVDNIASDHLSGSPGITEENGQVTNFALFPPNATGVKEVKENKEPSAASYDEDSPLNQFPKLTLDDSGTGSLKNADKIGRTDNSSSKLYNIDCKKSSNGHLPHFKGLLPRGLINSGNLCFLNATVQALLSCSPFVQLLQELRTRNVTEIGYPTLAAFAEFIVQFDVPSDMNLKKKDMTSPETGRPFCPVMFEDVLKNFTPDVPNSMGGRPRQEDAQEFLGFVMDQMHDELLKLEGQASCINGGSSSLVSSVEEDEWETVGPKNKSAVTRIQSFVPSELSEIFGGQLRSLVRAKGNRASATIQPYRLLHLDIHPDTVNTIEDALHLFSVPETLEGYQPSLSGKGAGVVTARKSFQILSLPKIMILHLKRFSYGSQGSTKLRKPVHFPLELVLGRDLLVSPTTEGRKFELVATITHHGWEPSKGHYTADARYPNGQWLRFDDASVFSIKTEKVLHDQAYVLFYKQM